MIGYASGRFLPPVRMTAMMVEY